MTIFKFELGSKLKDMVTGLTGICIGRNEWLNGCVQYCLKQPLDKDGKVIDGQWVDEAQLELLKGGLNITKKKTGGPMSDSPKC